MTSAQPLNTPDSLLDRAPCGFLSFQDDGRIALVNATLLEMLGYGRAELVGRHVEAILSVGTRIFYQTHLFPLARLRGSADEIFLLLRSKDGADIGVFANVRRRDAGADVAYDMALMRVTERQKYEEELIRARQVAEEARVLLEEQAAELEVTSEELHVTNEELLTQTEEADRLREMAETANRAKTEFLAVMSHELRTPLNAISGYVQILEMGIQGPLTEAQRETLGRVDRAQRHLLRLINDLLNLSKLEAGGVDYMIEAVSLAEAVASVVPMIEPQVAERGLTLTVEVSSELTASADRDKLEQILLNLLSNAVKFTPAGGRVTVRALRDASAGTVRIAVTDTGIGIPPDKLEAIFEPFVQVDSAKTRGTQGTGLGLAISRDLARGMNGELRVESRLDVGSTFQVVLPAA